MNKIYKRPKEPDWVIVGINIFIVLMASASLIISLWINISSSSVWNNGVCGKCNERFVVVKAFESINKYACPECDQEITRINWF